MTGATPPTLPGWSLALRFALELSALAALGRCGFVAVGGGAFGWAAGTASVIVAAAAWGTFAVPGDPSRSGRAPVPVSGAARLALEAAVFGGGAAALAALGAWAWLGAYAVGLVAHHASAGARVRWLLSQRQ